MAGHRNFHELRRRLDERPGADERRARAREQLDAQDAAYWRAVAAGADVDESQAVGDPEERDTRSVTE